MWPRVSIKKLKDFEKQANMHEQTNELSLG